MLMANMHYNFVVDGSARDIGAGCQLSRCNSAGISDGVHHSGIPRRISP